MKPTVRGSHANFYSRASCEARPGDPIRQDYIADISTHAPHARRGRPPLIVNGRKRYFYSRASCEARRCLRAHLLIALAFLLTRLMRGAAAQVIEANKAQAISTHAPHARRGLFKTVNLLPPRISTHAPHARRGATRILWGPSAAYISTHAPHARRGGTRLFRLT